MAELVAVTIHTQASKDAPPVSFELYGEVVAPGLAITPAVYETGYHGAWTLTHIESGRTLCRALCLPCCRRLARVAAESGADWTAAMEDVVKDPRAVESYRAGVDLELACDGRWACDG